MQNFKRLLIVLVAFATIFVITSCCGTKSYTDTQKINDIAPKDSVKVVVSENEKFTIILEENPTTGYSWTQPTFDQSILTLISNEYIAPDSKLTGAPGMRKLIFQGKTTGKTTVAMQYIRSWDPKDNPKYFREYITVIK